MPFTEDAATYDYGDDLIPKPAHLFKKRKVKIYDCFTYYDEEVMLNMRMNTLADYVDYFVISESPRTYSGLPKPLYFNRTKFSKYEDKIIHLVFDNPELADVVGFPFEGLARDYLANGL